MKIGIGGFMKKRLLVLSFIAFIALSFSFAGGSSEEVATVSTTTSLENKT